MTHNGSAWFNKNKLPATAVIAGTLTFLVFIRSVFNGFVNMDDPDYVLNNPLVKALDWNHIVAAFSSVHAGFWMPLTWISLAIDFRLWGLNPAGYHLTNVILHSINTGLVVLLADRLLRDERRLLRDERREMKDEGNPELSTLIGSSHRSSVQYSLIPLLAGLLWGLHPLRVESVAWVTERKDVLNGLLFLGSLLMYLSYARNSKIQHSSFRFRRDYILSLTLFIMSLLAKPVSVVLPVMLLVLDWCPLGRLRKGNVKWILLEKAPFLLCSGAMVVATLNIARQSNILAAYDNLSIVQRLTVSGNALFEYCRFMILPAGMLPLHVIDASQMTSYALKGGVFVLFSAVVIGLFRKERWPVVALLLFLLPLLPVLAFFQNGLQAFASRFTYLPALAPSIMIAFLAGSIYRMKEKVWPEYTRQALLLAGGFLVVTYVSTTWRYIGIWKSTETVWSRIIDLQPTGRAFKERGLYYLSTGQDAAAEQDLTVSISFAQKAAVEEIYKLYALRGVALINQERYPEAIDDFSRAISSCSDLKYYYYRGRAFEAMGKSSEASADFQRSGPAAGPIEWGNSACR